MIILDNAGRAFPKGRKCKRGFPHPVWGFRSVCGRIEPGQVLVLLGASGSGKSTLLRCIQGLDPLTEGHIQRDPYLRVGMVFQNFNLFPHMTLLQNVTYAPSKVGDKCMGLVTRETKSLLERLGLVDKQDTYPRNLSGGEKQRAAIARALAMEPDILLFDEPTSALDPGKVRNVLDLLRSLAQNMTVVVATHDIAFAKGLSNCVWFLEQGRLLESSLAGDFFQSPQTLQAQSLLADML